MGAGGTDEGANGKREGRDDDRLQQWRERNEEAAEVDFQKELEVGLEVSKGAWKP